MKILFCKILQIFLQNLVTSETIKNFVEFLLTFKKKIVNFSIILYNFYLETQICRNILKFLVFLKMLQGKLKNLRKPYYQSISHKLLEVCREICLCGYIKAHHGIKSINRKYGLKTIERKFILYKQPI